jgi:hypothetical protein
MTYEDVVLEQKLSYLRRLLKIYVRFLKYYSDVELTVKEKTIEVKYCKAKNNGYAFQAKEFPREHLGRQIVHYRNKVRAMFKNRHTNTNWR